MKQNADMEDVFVEYLDVLVTIEIAVAIAEKDRRPVNRTLKACWAAIRPRVKFTKVRSIFDGLPGQKYPVGALKMLRRQLDMIASD